MPVDTKEELELLERVLLRMGCADTDEQLQTAISKFLAPVLLKITSPYEAVRLKVMEVLTHINKRLKSRPLVQIPIEPLLVQYQETSSSFATNFCIIYITMGFPRMETTKQVEIVPTLLNCLEGKPETHQDKILMLVLPLLGQIKIPEEKEEQKSFLGLSNRPATKKQLLSLLEDVLLLPYGITQDGEVPAGMSLYSFKRVIANNWKAEELEQLKKSIVKFLSSETFSEMESLAPLITASADTRFSVATPAIAELSKFSTALDWMNPAVSAPLYNLFSGNGSKIPDRKTSPCSARVRQKLLQYLLKCRGRGINTVKGIQVIFEALFGENTNQKCKVLALQFADNLIQDGPKDLITKLSKVILGGLSKIVGSSSTESFDVQSAAYAAVAKLSKVCPEVVNKDLQIVVTYFKNLAESATELNTPIRDALVAIAPAFSWINQDSKDNEMEVDAKDFRPNSNQTLLLALMTENADSKSVIIQNVTCVFLTTCFPQFFVPARYLLLIIAGQRPQLKESIMIHLYGTSKKDHINYSYITSIDSKKTQKDENIVNKLSSEQLTITLPSFKDMANFIYTMAEKRINNNLLNFVYGKVTLAYNFETYVEILDYLRMCFWYSAGAESYPGDQKNSYLLCDYINNNYDKSTFNEIQKYMELIKILVKARRGIIELSCLLDLLNVAPDILSQQNFDLSEILSESLKEVSENTRSLVGQLYGILIAHGKQSDEFNSQIREMLQMSQTTLEHKHGITLAIANAFHRKFVIMKDQNDFDWVIIQKWVEFKNTIEYLINLLSAPQPLLISAAVKSISLIGSMSPLPIPDDKPEKMEINDEELVELSKDKLLKSIVSILNNNGMKNKIREESAHCLGYLSIGDGKYFTKKVFTIFLNSNKMTKDPALQIAIGQALVYTAQGRSDAISNKQQNSTSTNCDDEMFEWFLKELIKLVPFPHVYSRQACAIWLLALVKNCSSRSAIRDNKNLLQLAFTDLLSEDNELVQDVSSRGLGIVFSLSDIESQTELATSLLETLSGGRKTVKKITDDSKIFEEGALGKTPSGGNITTYKELCSLASDLNQPDLIYQFMQLANHNAVWNSKLGAAFGLQSISKTAKVKIQPYLKNIVPRLFRYKYDPTPKIQNSMISIWDSIVTDSKETIELYYWEILGELITNLTHTEWRVRIACCLAIRDLIKRPSGLKLKFDSIEDSSSNKMETDEVSEPELLELWTQIFRVMDDIHEGTRLAAEGTAVIISKVCIVAASGHGKSSLKVSSSILPFLLTTGVTHTVPEIRQLSLKTISELIDAGGSIIVPHLPQLVPCLLQATGELEVSKLSYLSTRHAGNEMQDAIDTVRAEAAKSHYCSETLAKCLRYINYSELEKMTPAVLDLMKTTVNLGSKIACAHFLCSISIRLGKEMTPLIGKYMKSCFNGLSDRNPTVRKYYAGSIGHLIGYAKESTVLACFSKLIELYFEQQTNKAIPQVIHSINKRHADVLKDFAPQVLPLVFFAMHEELTEDNKNTVELWKELWNDISPGNSGIRMNLETIIPILERSMDSSSWLLKAQSANSINSVATRLETNLDNENRIKLINLILTNISGRTFQGKERYLEALSALSKNLSEPNLQVKIIDAVMKEARKEEPKYRTYALKSLGDILDEFQEDHFEEVYNMVWYLLDKQDVPTGNNDDPNRNLSSEERKQRATVSIGLKEAVCLALGKAWPVNSADTQKKYQIMFVEKCVECLQTNTRPVQISLLVALGRFLDRLKVLEAIDGSNNTEKKVKIEADVNSMLEKIVQDVLWIIVYVAGIPHTGLKKEALNILLILVKRLKLLKDEIVLATVRKTYDEILITLQKDSAPEIRCRLKDITDKLNE